MHVIHNKTLFTKLSSTDLLLIKLHLELNFFSDSQIIAVVVIIDAYNYKLSDSNFLKRKKAFSHYCEKALIIGIDYILIYFPSVGSAVLAKLLPPLLLEEDVEEDFLFDLLLVFKSSARSLTIGVATNTEE